MRKPIGRIVVTSQQFPGLDRAIVVVGRKGPIVVERRFDCEFEVYTQAANDAAVRPNDSAEILYIEIWFMRSSQDSAGM